MPINYPCAVCNVCVICVYCVYLTSSEFNKIPFPPDAFSAFHINIRSLPKHFDDLLEYLLSLNMLFSVVAVSETWLRKSNSLITWLNKSNSIIF